MIEKIITSMTMAEDAPIPIELRVNVYEYINVAGSSVALPGPPPVRAMIRS